MIVSRAPESVPVAATNKTDGKPAKKSVVERAKEKLHRAIERGTLKDLLFGKNPEGADNNAYRAKNSDQVLQNDYFSDNSMEYFDNAAWNIVMMKRMIGEIAELERPNAAAANTKGKRDDDDVSSSSSEDVFGSDQNARERKARAKAKARIHAKKLETADKSEGSKSATVKGKSVKDQKLAALKNKRESVVKPFKASRHDSTKMNSVSDSSTHNSVMNSARPASGEGASDVMGEMIKLSPLFLSTTSGGPNKKARRVAHILRAIKETSHHSVVEPADVTEDETPEVDEHDDDESSVSEVIN